MKNQLKPNQIGIEVNDVDLNKICRVGKKVQVFLCRKIDDPFEIYLLLKILCYSLEEKMHFLLDPEDEQALRKIFA